MPIQKIFSKVGEQIISTFNFADIATNTGYITTFGAKDNSGGVLTGTELFSQTVDTKAEIDSATYAQKLDIDFDIELGKSLTLEGQCIFNVPLVFTADTDATFNAYVYARVRKVVAGVESEIASISGAEITWIRSSGSFTSQDSVTSVIKVDVPKTKWNAGDFIRITCEAWAKESAGGVNKVHIGHDPKNREMDVLNGSLSAARYSSVLTILLPVKINL